MHTKTLLVPKKDKELKTIEKEVITQRRALAVVDHPQVLKRKVDGSRITPKFLRVSSYLFECLSITTRKTPGDVVSVRRGS